MKTMYAADQQFSRSKNQGVFSFCLAVASLLCALGADAAVLPARQTKLIRAEQIRKLTPEQANSGCPVHLRGVVTYVDRDQFFFQDSTGGVRVELSDAQNAIEPGHLVEMEGRTRLGEFSPVVTKPVVRIQKEAQMPDARLVSIEELAYGSEDGQWIEIKGIVRAATIQEGKVSLEIRMGGRRLKVYVMNVSLPEASDLIDSVVRLRGVCGAILNQNGQYMGIQLFVPGPGFIKIEEKPSTDPFSLPIRPINSLLRFKPDEPYGHRVRVQGTVFLQRPGRALFIKDDTGGIYVGTLEETHLNPGDYVDVVGFADPDEDGPVLQNAIFRHLHSGPPPVPVALTAEQALDLKYDDHLVRIEAKLVELSLRSDNQILILQSENLIFQAHMEDEQAGQMLASIQPASILQLTGICSIRRDRNRVPQSLRLRLRSSSDIVVLKRPSWWTLRHTMWVLAATVLVILMALGWVAVLRRRVRKQTEIIRASLEKEAALEQRYRNLVENANDIIYTTDLEANITSINRMGELVLGYPAEQLLKMNLFEFVQPAHQQYLRDIRERKIRGEALPSYELEVIGRDGHKRMLEINSRLIGDGEEPAGFEEIARDVTERRLAEEAIRESEDRYRRLVELSPEAIAVHGDGRFIYTNPAGLKLFGAASEEEFIGKPILDTVHPDYREVVQSRIELYNEGKQSPLIEQKLIRFDGQVIDVEIIGMPITYECKPAVQVVIRDITERKSLERQLRQSQKMEAIGRLAGGVAHDFNNLLTVILGYSRSLNIQFAGDEEVRADIEEIDKAGKRAASLTSQLLALSRKQVLQPKVLDLNAVVANTEKMLRRLIGEDIDLITNLRPDLGRVEADPGQIEQVLMNLAINARDAMPEGGKLLIETENVNLDESYTHNHVGVEPGPYVMVAVSDTGVGMDQQTMSHIFEPFFTTKAVGRGTGLGLSTVFGIVKQSGGNIWVYSEPGHGTTFKIYLPRVQDKANTVTLVEGSKTLPRGEETVLLAEDDEAVRRMAARVLRDQGYNVIEASNGEEALNLVQNQPQTVIDLLLTDVIMPQISGRALSQAMKGLRPHTAVLFMSGYTDDAIIHHGVLESGLAFLQKPFMPETLARKVREVLDARQMGSPGSGVRSPESAIERFEH